MSDQAPLTSSKKALKAFRRLGFRPAHKKGGGSHLSLIRDHPDDPDRPPDITVIPMGKSELDRFTLKSALDLAGVSPAEFNRALR